MAQEDEALGGEAGRGLVARVVAEELGEEWARRIDQIWRRLDEAEDTATGEGLRERKKRQTRQRMSDVATAMFVARGYENVKISEIAERVGVSEKTIYNYFPTKESLVYDQADAQLLLLAAAIRDRQPGSSPTAAFVAALKADVARFNAAIRETAPADPRMEFLTAFAEMIRETPALRAAWGEHRHLMVETITAILAGEAGVDPRDPEPVTAARALVSLLELLYDSQMRHVAAGIDPDGLQAAIEADLDRAARLLDTGLWSFNLMVEGRKTKDQLREAAAAAEQARRQVLKALRDAKLAFREIRGQARIGGREAMRQGQTGRSGQRLRGRGR